MRRITFTLLIIISFSSCNNSSRQKSPVELKMELKRQEQSNVRQYLSLDNVFINKNKIKEAGIFSSAKYDGHLITGKVKNTATIARFKDIKLRLQLFSKTKTLISEKTYVFYEYYEPNSIKNFSLKINPPIAMKSYNISVVSAESTQ